jgi:signal transduction histidine kinase/ligand-binding sensor domain-containing protein/DNA-binding response OmpR family regulator
MKSISIYIILVLFLPCSLISQEKNTNERYFPDPKFEYLTINDELPDQSISSILQDRFGYIWLGTEHGGLVKYNGYTMTIYRTDPDDSLTISHPGIRTIYEDRSGTLWIGTQNGLNRFNRKTETFTYFLDSDLILGMYEDKTGNFWVATGSSLTLLDRKTNQFQRYIFPDSTYKRIEAITGDSINSILYLGTRDGLFMFDLNKKIIEPFKSNASIPDRIYSFCQTRDGFILIGSQNGLASLNPKTKQISFYHSIHSPVKYIFQDNDGFIWCYTVSERWVSGDSELILVNPKNGEFKRRKSDIILSMYQDHSGIIWMGAGYVGLLKWDKRKLKFKSYKHDPDNKNSLISNYVNAVYKDSKGIIWNGTDKGLNRFDREKNKFELLNNFGVTAILEDSSGYLWLGTLNKGLALFDPVKETYRFYSHNPIDTASLSSNYVFSLHIDNQGVLWVGTFDRGLNRFDKNSGKFTRYLYNSKDSTSLSHNSVIDIYEDHNGILWIGTGEGVNRFDRKSGGFKSLKELNNRITSVYEFDWRESLNKDRPATSVTSIYEDTRGNFWLSTIQSGLYLFDKEKFIPVKNFNEKNGLAAVTMTSINEDASGNLWIRTNNGISKFDKQTQSFRNYSSSDGIPIPSKMAGPFFAAKSLDGEFLVCSVDGFFTFYPDSIKDDPIPPKVVLSNISLFNKPGKNLDYDGFQSEIKEMELPYNHNDLKLDFVALHYGEPGKNRYKYILENFDHDWVDAGFQRNATYTNLSPGEYIFRVKACNRDGVWNEEGASIRILITPPFWATWWAYSFYVIFFGSILYGARRYEMNRVNWKNQVKLDEVKLREKEDTDRMKSRFFANISHEFRTPLTLILGPSEKIISNSKEKETQKQTSLIKRNASRLLDLVNQLLDLSKLEAGKLKLRVSQGNIVSFVKGITMSFESLAERKNIILNFKAIQNDIELYFDRDKIAKILTNLLSNAFKFTGEGGEITVSISLSHAELDSASSDKIQIPIPINSGRNDRINIRIQDTGIGISEDELPKLFDRFYQTDSSQTKVHEGSGIGLALTKELVELHHGNIQVKSTIGEGSTFTIEFPLGKEHLNNDEMVVEEEADSSVILNTANNLTRVNLDNAALDSSRQKVGQALPDSNQTSQNDDEEKEEKTIILIVEDNTDVRNYIKDSLTNNYQIEEASNGEQGIKKSEQIIPDLIISDIMMPEMDGNELTRRIKNDERTSHIPVILLTAKSQQESKIEGLETGADDYITKPFDTKELQVRIKNLITIRKRLYEKYSRGDYVWKKKKISSLDERFMNKVTEVIENHISEEDFNIEQFSKEIGMSRVQLYRKLKALSGKSASHYIRSVRLFKARKMLQENQSNISEIAYSVGFSTPQYFTKCFKEEFGYLPSDLIH